MYENIVLPVELDGDTVDQKFLDEIVHLLGLEAVSYTHLAEFCHTLYNVYRCKIFMKRHRHRLCRAEQC